REIVYTRRQKILQRIAEAEAGQSSAAEAGALHGDIVATIEREARAIAAAHTTERDPEKWDLATAIAAVGAFNPEAAKSLDIEALKKLEDRAEVEEKLVTALVGAYERACAAADPVAVGRAERVVTLRSIDTHWMNHIDEMSHLREQVAFSGFAQRDPLVEYQDQGFRKFQQLIATIDSTIARMLLQADFSQFAAPVRMAEEQPQNLITNADQIEAELTHTGVGVAADQSPSAAPARRVPLPHERPSSVRVKAPPAQAASAAEVGRNDPCPCGSGKKYKKCHGQDA
ncbi:MAG: SEC-C domain-containing protein, partial [Candidatus Peribacteraceae bacterium]|nr:SEC-C domain-containing protein [Candidatus Peribacteraceae bacterium]